MTLYWWASQNFNHEEAMRQRTLWTQPQENGTVPAGRKLIHALQPGDVVFHYQHKFIRAVSVVTESVIEYPRPEHYGEPFGDARDDGWLVQIRPIREHLRIAREVFVNVIAPGGEGPLYRDARQAEKYLSKIDPAEGEQLLVLSGISTEELGVEGDHGPGLAPVQTSAAATPTAPWTLGTTETDVLGEARLRLEQRKLREYLLGRRLSAPCAICGAELPREFLVAGHIMPRAKLSHEERLDFERVAMLVCTLGCDALFERRYLVVRKGIIEAGRPAESPNLAAAVSARVGLRCGAWTALTRHGFEAHARLV